MSDLDKDMKGGRVRRVGAPKDPEDAVRLQDLQALSTIQTVQGGLRTGAGGRFAGGVPAGIRAISAGTSLATGQTVSFRDANGVTFGVSVNTVTASVAAPIASATVVSAVGVSTGGNTAGDTGTRVGTVVFEGGNQITLSQITAVGDLATIIASGRNAVFGIGVSTGGNTAGDTGTRTGTIVFAGIGDVTLSQATAVGGSATISISVSTAASASVVSAIGVSTGGNTAGDTGTRRGTVVFAGAGIVTLSQATAVGNSATITISASQSVQPGIQSISAGTTRITTGELVFSNANGISFGADGQTVTASVAAGATATGNVGGIAAGTQTATSGTVIFSNSNGISFGMAGSATVTVSVQANSISSATTASQVTTTNVVGADVGRYALEGHQHAGIAAGGISTGGNTSGTSGTNFGTLVLAGINGITLSQATGAGGNTITISGITQSNPRITLFSNPLVWHTNNGIQDGILSLQKVSLPMQIAATRVQMLMAMTSLLDAAGSLSVSVGIYTLSGSTASLASSASRLISWTTGGATSDSTVFIGVSGTRYRTISASFAMTPGDYLLGIHMRTGGAGNWRVFGREAANIGAANDANETNYFLDGLTASSFITGLPSSVNVTDTNYVRTGGDAMDQPGFIMIGTF